MDRGFDFLYSNPNLTLFIGIPDSKTVGHFGYEDPSNPLTDGTGSWVRSKFNPTSFINYRGQKWNRGTYKPYGVEKFVQGGSELQSNIEDQHKIDIIDLIKWSNGYAGGNGVPMMRFNLKDFIYCKDHKKYANNRLIVLRRFAGPIGNQLFGPYGPTPIATVVSWIPPSDGGGDDKLPFTISFHEIWQDFNKSLFETLKETISALELPIGKITPNHPVFKTLQISLMNKLGITPLDVEGYFGNPNIVSSTMARPIATGGNDGLSSDIKFTVDAAYEYHYYGGVDPATIMLDIVANIIKMGTSDAVFQLTGAFGSGVASTVNRLMNGDITGLIQDIISAVIEAIKGLITTVISAIKDFAKAISTGDPGSIIGALVNGFGKLYFQGILAEKKPQIMAAIAGSTGSPVGAWHVMIGNPKKPIISCGNLVIQSVSIDMSNQLGFDDWPTTIYAKFTLTSARPLGASDIESIYNAGQQRIYYTGFLKQGTTVKGAFKKSDQNTEVSANGTIQNTEVDANDANAVAAAAAQDAAVNDLETKGVLSDMFEPNDERKDFLYSYLESKKPLSQRKGLSPAESKTANSYSDTGPLTSIEKEAKLKSGPVDAPFDPVKAQEEALADATLQRALFKESQGEKPNAEEQAAIDKYKKSSGQTIPGSNTPNINNLFGNNNS